MSIGTLFCGSCGMNLRASSSFDRPQTIQPEKQSKAPSTRAKVLVLIIMISLGLLIGGLLVRNPPPPIPIDTGTPLPEKPTPQPEPPVPPVSLPDLLPGRHQIIAKENVPIHDVPEATAKIIGERGPGQTVIVTKVSGQWIEIRSKKGTVGYIPRDVVATELLPEDEQQSAVPAPKE